MMKSTFHDPFDCKITCEEFYGEEPAHDECDDLVDSGMSVEILDEDWDADPEPLITGSEPNEDDLFDAAGGLTAEAYTLLGEMDRQGFFV
tara:strand:- start:305 stop:574 length:270 start_codon:yes stop_codon:yes gene_type:complete